LAEKCQTQPPFKIAEADPGAEKIPGGRLVGADGDAPRKEKAMSALRQRMIEDMQLHGYSAKTQTAYLGAVRGLAGHYHRTPEDITQDELRSYFLSLVKTPTVRMALTVIYACGLRLSEGLQLKAQDIDSARMLKCLDNRVHFRYQVLTRTENAVHPD